MSEELEGDLYDLDVGKCCQELLKGLDVFVEILLDEFCREYGGVKNASSIGIYLHKSSCVMILDGRRWCRMPPNFLFCQKQLEAVFCGIQ